MSHPIVIAAKKSPAPSVRSAAQKERSVQVRRGKSAIALQEYAERGIQARGGLDQVDQLIVQTARLSPGVADGAPYDFARNVLERYIASQAARAGKN